MKKIIILFILIFLFPSFSFANYTYTRTPSGNGTYENIQIDFQSDTYAEICNPSNLPVLYDRYAIVMENIEEGQGYIPLSIHNDTDLSIVENYTFSTTFEVERIGVACWESIFGEDYVNVVSVLEFNNAPFLFIGGIDVPQSALSSMLSEGETAYQNTTGENMGSTVSWAGDSLVKLFIGSSLAVFLALRYWIVAIIIIQVIIFFYKRNKNI